MGIAIVNEGARANVLEKGAVKVALTKLKARARTNDPLFWKAHHQLLCPH
jgi:hypothetical protein